MKRLKYLLPLALFVVLAGFLVKGLYLDPHEVPSPLIGKPAPAFELQDLQNLDRRVSSDTLKGKVWLMNVWASWCESCREEHPYIMQLRQSGELTATVVGLQYKDKVAPGVAFLNQYGNPYTMILRDPEGKLGIDYGVYGVPETFVVDKKGVIRHKVIGPMMQKAWNQDVKPLIKKLEAE
ncbi:MAG: DsbE family thiol:disulfide interchange protein [Sutterellaceae bacterium]|nr:DsbE family thiol:disulfide interchange protein [Sutterellaceae bacterium]